MNPDDTLTATGHSSSVALVESPRTSPATDESAIIATAASLKPPRRPTFDLPVHFLHPLLWIGPLAFLAVWATMASTFYERQEPFYDSLGVQVDTVETIKRIQTHGSGEALSILLQPRTTVAYRLAALLLAWVLPASVPGVTLIVFSFAAYAIAATIVAVSSFASRWAAAATTYCLLSMAIFGQLYGGILDQRLDFVAGLLLVASVASVWSVVDQPGRRSRWCLAGVTIAIAALQRPIAVTQITAVVAAMTLVRPKAVLHACEPRHYLGMLLAFGPMVVAAAVLSPSFGYLWHYYSVMNYDVGVSSLAQSARLAAAAVVGFIGVPTLVVLALSGVYALWANRALPSCRALVVLMASCVPYAAAGATENTYPLIGAALVAALLPPIALEANLRPRFAQSVALVSLALAVARVSELNEAVRHVDDSNRRALTAALLSIIPQTENGVISGIAPEIGPLVALDHLYGNGELKFGKLLFHSTEFGLDRAYEAGPMDQAGWMLVKERLRTFCSQPALVIAFEESYRDREAPNHFVYRFGAELSDEIRRLPCIRGVVARFQSNGVGLVAYRAADGQPGAEPSPRASPAQDIVAHPENVSLGGGWYDYEVFGGEQFRWAAQAAELTVFGRPGQTGTLELIAAAGPALAGQTMRLRLEDRSGNVLARSELEGRGDVRWSVPVPASGIRALIVRLEGATGPPTKDDPRVLGFRVFRVSWTP